MNISKTYLTEFAIWLLTELVNQGFSQSLSIVLWVLLIIDTKNLLMLAMLCQIYASKDSWLIMRLPVQSSGTLFNFNDK